MSEQQPPTGPSYDGPTSSGSSPDYGPPPTAADTVTFGGSDGRGSHEPRGRRTWWYAGGGAVVAIAVVAGGIAFAATHLSSEQDAGAAAGLPRNTLAYAGVDLDPSASQKIEALRALRKFPGFAHGTHLNPSSDLRKMTLEDSLKSDGCHLDWTKDVASWLGEDVGAAVVPAGSAGPQPVAVLAVTDESKAKKDLPKLLACDDDSGSVAVSHGWAVIAKNDTIAKSVSASAQHGSLADDSDFKTWTDRTGDPGVATFYASKAAGAALADHLDQLDSLLGLSTSASDSAASSSAVAPAAYSTTAGATASDPGDPFGAFTQICPRPAADGSGELSKAQLQQIKKSLADFQGAAATLRFAHGGFEVELVSSGGTSKRAPAGLAGMTTLPRDTAIAFGGAASAPETIDLLAQSFATEIAAQCGNTPTAVLDGVAKLSGLTLPDDLHTLFGHGFAVGASGKVDAAALAGGDPSKLPVGLKLQGDPQQIGAVLHKLHVPAQVQQVLGTTDGDGVVAVGPDADYRAELAKKGDLGSSSTFQDVVPHADQANAAFYIDFTQLRSVINGLDDHDKQVDQELAHVKAFGESAWAQDGIEHGLMRLSLQ